MNDQTFSLGINKKLAQMAQELMGIELQRFPVPAGKRDWHCDFPGYQPPHVDLPRGNTPFAKAGDQPDPLDPRQIRSFESFETPQVQRDEQGYPLNPRGRTGLRGRGMLDRWGPTHAADPVVTRTTSTGEHEVLLIERTDTGEWALPGGKVDPGELPWQSAGRELLEEAGLRLDFSTAHTLYQGYVDDSRATDNAWLETTVLHYHLTPDEAAHAHIEAGSDASQARWMPIDAQLYDSLFASHDEFVRKAAAILG